ncbi:DUF5668 domain-containing protein [Robertmurraya sp. FSL W8-0741]|uniref:LiaF transmembrane domain-containing protein n=1 Tax=Robertmurraya TaxID=2837507 RepID=UPI000BA57D77|nr:DUF5668 domain-containing protein [Robertmurraya siralis]PAE21312.1 hypothetical protein CHH80_07555 [Bacillus sp. 7504-2]
MMEEKQIRTWRVGTISMGASLLFLGIFLLLSQFFDLSMMSIMISWWPIILIILGIEILLYLFVSRKEKPFLKYDFLSIFFVGMIGTIGIAFAIVSSLGITNAVGELMTREERTVELPPFSQTIDQNIKRIVLKTEHEIAIEGTNSQEISMFGTYTATFPTGEKKLLSKVEDYMSINTKGDTLYLEMKNLPNGNGPFYHYYGNMEVTILVPKDVKFEITGQNNRITLKPRELSNNWLIENAGEVSLLIQENSDVEISAQQVQDLLSETSEWTVTSKPEFDGDLNQNGRMKIGAGTHSIDIKRAYQVNVSTVSP